MGISGIWADCNAGNPSRNIFAEGRKADQNMKFSHWIYETKNFYTRERDK